MPRARPPSKTTAIRRTTRAGQAPKLPHERDESNDTPAKEYIRAKELGATLNLDDITHVEFVERCCGGLPEMLSFRYNPGPLRQGNVIIGVPEEAKYGLTREQLFEAYRTSKDRGVKRFGLHTMVASNELDRAYFVETARMLFQLARELREQLDQTRRQLEDRKLVEKAKGLLMAAHAATEEQAFATLRKLAMDCHRTLGETAGEVIAILDKHRHRSERR